MGIGVIFIVVESVVYLDGALKGDCLMRKVVEARRVDVRSVVRRGWWRRRQSICGGKFELGLFDLGNCLESGE